MKRVPRLRFVDLWQPSILIMTGLVVCLFLYGIFLNSLVSGFSNYEIGYSSQTTSLSRILSDPVWLPHKIGQYTAVKLNLSNVIGLRLPSVIIGFLCVFLFYYLIRQWHTARVSTLTTVLFMTSAWMLHVSRAASPDILLILAPLVLLASGMYFRHSRMITLSMICGASAAALALYIPYVAPLLIPLGLWQLWSFTNSKRRPSWRSLGLAAVFFLVLSLPLIIIIASGRPVPSEYFLFSKNSFSGYIKNLSDAFLAISYSLPQLDASRWLGKTPLLDIGTSLFLLIGLLTSLKRWRLIRVRLAIMLSMYGLVLVSFTGDARYIGVSFAPFYLLVAEGISYILNIWFSTFPKNPLARIYGANFVSIVVLLAVFYNLNHYFIAWPLSPETKLLHTNLRSLR